MVSQRYQASLLALFLIVGCVPAAKPLTADEFARLYELVLPSPQEDAWAGIPWETSLWEARRKAAAQGKPILLWEMNGQPLGCT